MPENDQRTRFVVVGEHTLGCINPIQPNVIQVLHGSLLAGSSWGSYQLGTIPVPLCSYQMRPATREDFDTFRISTDGYENNSTHYDFPKGPDQ